MGIFVNNSEYMYENTQDNVITMPIKSLSANELEGIFENDTSLSGSLEFPFLTSIGNYAMQNMFSGCTGLSGTVNFPSLTTVGTNGLNNAFNGCTGITAIHFKSSAQSVIQSQASYATNFGAPNATIYFDL